jgi:hypothetical protein
VRWRAPGSTVVRQERFLDYGASELKHFATRMAALGAAPMLGPLELAATEPMLFWSACFRSKEAFKHLTSAAEAARPGLSADWVGRCRLNLSNPC